ncbi:tRNA pseudouridine(55) synthase TruB [Paenibacillus sp. GCM10012307]|uniref:tRNA pseudouridine synthase B n=1 Tax=Paenibacillus roseus TaxID=2798579 RepID=A0A934J7X8_9BACL|nr:tRNA pseudouridine(55) synthase TruB [Paenibacillus roseus]MBJ6363424.1 tRNA pseudouridine(55) synthase TruB [Paenibacillus roseus]
MDGILAVWKPAGWTSHDVVAKARRLLRTRRIGHAGTLDPDVTGVLPLCIGRSTRVVEYMQHQPKSYEAVLQFGIATDTEDLSGQVIEDAGPVSLSLECIREALASFAGEIEQTPPMYSAVKVNGKRLYELAREGKVVERKARKVTIFETVLLAAELERPYPQITFSVTCSSGTYIRTLCVDLGKALGVPAAMAKLTRTSSAGLHEQDCLTLDEIELLQEQGTIGDRLLPADRALAHMPAFTVDSSSGDRLLQGQKVKLDVLLPVALEHGLCRLYNESGLFLGIFQTIPEDGIVKPVKVFS